MPTALPIIRGSFNVLYPFTQTYICFTGVQDTENGSTTRWVTAPPIVKFDLNYKPVTQANRNTLRAALTSAKGQFDTSLEITTDAGAFDNLSFDDDQFSAVQPQGAGNNYEVKWSLTQTIPANLSPPASGGAYPLLSSGYISQLPYTQSKRFSTIVSKMDYGPKYSFAQFGAGLTGFPTDGLMSWDLDEHGLSDAEVATKTAHFLANWGNAMPFTFNDEIDGTSSSAVVAGTGSKTFATQAGLGYTSGNKLRVVSRGGSATLIATVTSYSGTTLIVNVTVATGSGTHVDWNLSRIYSNVYYGSPQLVISREQRDQSSIHTVLTQMF